MQTQLLFSQQFNEKRLLNLEIFKLKWHEQEDVVWPIIDNVLSLYLFSLIF